MTEITTVRDLAALPVGSVVRDSAGNVYERRADHLNGGAGVVGFEWIVEVSGPLTLLYRPDRPEPSMTDRQREVFVKLARFVDQHHWYDSNDCHPIPGEDCSPWCSACEVLRHVDDQILREAREASGHAR